MLMKIIPLAMALLLFAPGLSTTQEAVAAGHGERTEAKVNLNSADLDALIGVRGIGPALAEAIIKLRTKKGAFTSIDELLEVSGIGENTLSLIQGSLTLTPPSSPTALQSPPSR